MRQLKFLIPVMAGLLCFAGIGVASADVLRSLKGLGEIVKTVEELPKNLEAEVQPDQVEPAVQTRSPLDQLAGNDVLTATLTGAAVGAAIGAISDGSDGAKKGALIGGAAGFIAGNVAAQRRKEFASEDAFLDAEIKAAENAVSTKEEQLATLETELDSTRRRIAVLEYRFEQNEDITVEAEKEFQALTEQVRSNEQTAQNYQNSIDYLDEVLSTSEAESAAKAEEKEAWEEREATLIAKRADLNQQYARLTGINDDMNRERTLVAGLVKKAKERG